MSCEKTILVADDEPNLRRVLGSMLRREGHRVIAASDGEDALGALSKNEIHAIITDLRMPRMDGMALLKRVTSDYPDLPVIILTAHGSVDNAVAAVKLGAFDYLEKPFDQQQIRQVISKALRTNELRRREVQLTGTNPNVGRYGLIGTSAAMQAVYNVIEKVADTPSTVLITGESGTGKELVAKAIHEQGPRAQEPLIKVNCAAIPDTLIESELFGHEKGAFTGAVSSKPGRFELADKGTLFLDEIGDIPLEMQVKLLRALQENEFERVGGIKTIRVDVRMIAATNSDLVAAIEAGQFREDLYYRLNVVPIHVPPLRERRSDIPLLVDHILQKFWTRLDKHIRRVDPAVMETLARHSWPGNIRELENLLERTLLFCETDELRPGDLPPPFRPDRDIDDSAPRLEVAAHAEALGPTVGAVIQTAASDGTGLPDAEAEVRSASLKDIVRAETERLERDLIRAALDETGGNVTHAARRLKISRKSLQNKMKELGLRDPDHGPST